MSLKKKKKKEGDVIVIPVLGNQRQGTWWSAYSASRRPGRDPDLKINVDGSGGMTLKVDL